MKEIFAFWQSEKPMPGYLQLCIDTWYKNIPDLKVHFVNHSNLNEYLGNLYPLDQLKKLSYAKQSDIISAALLEKYGGLFIDVDTIIISDLFEIFAKFDDNKLVGFGFPPNKGMHLAVLYCKNPGNPILTEWRREAQRRLLDLPENTSWDYVGNSILNPLFKLPENKDYFEILNRTQVGNILESVLMKAQGAKEGYQKLYFEVNSEISVLETLNYVKYGVISLHNSWTPKKFSDLSKEQFLEKNIYLRDLLKCLLFNDEFLYLKGFFHDIDLQLKSIKKTSSKRIWTKGMYVVDFVVNNAHYALDIVKDDKLDLYYLDLVLRNDQAKKVFKNYVENTHKARLGVYDSFEILICSIFHSIVFFELLVETNSYPSVLKLSPEKNIYCEFSVIDKKLIVDMNVNLQNIQVYFSDNSPLGPIYEILSAAIGEYRLDTNILYKNIESLPIDEKIRFYLNIFKRIKDWSFLVSMDKSIGELDIIDDTSLFNNSANIGDYKSKLNVEPQIYEFTELKGDEKNRFNVRYKNITFECFLANTDMFYNKLFVFFSSGGRNTSETTFQRISWSSKLKGLCLYIEDPMYKIYGDIGSGWYFGDKKESMLLQILNIVNIYTQKFNIKNQNVFFVGASSAGYAALYCANRLKGSLAYAYNPQIDLIKSPNYNKFLKKTNIKLDGFSDSFFRQDISYILENKESIFYLFFNFSSAMDMKHLHHLVKTLDYNITPGTYVHNNTNIMVEDINNSNPHMCVGGIEDFIINIGTRNVSNGEKIDILNASLIRFKNYILNIEEKFYKNLWNIHFLQPLPDFILKRYQSKENYIEFVLEDETDLFIYQTSFLRLKNIGEVRLIIKNNNLTSSQRFLDIVDCFCREYKAELEVNSLNMSVIWKISNVQHIYKETLDFMNLTYKQIIESFYSLVENSPVLYLKKADFDSYGKTHLEGVFFLRGIACKEYSDVKYSLKLKSQRKEYVFILAKGHRPEISKDYYKDYFVNYDKAYFCSSNYLGLNLLEIDEGIYKLYIKIELQNGMTQELELKSQEIFEKHCSKNLQTLISTEEGLFYKKSLVRA